MEKSSAVVGSGMGWGPAGPKSSGGMSGIFGQSAGSGRSAMVSSGPAVVPAVGSLVPPAGVLEEPAGVADAPVGPEAGGAEVAGVSVPGPPVAVGATADGVQPVSTSTRTAAI